MGVGDGVLIVIHLPNAVGDRYDVVANNHLRAAIDSTPCCCIIVTFDLDRFSNR